MTSRTRSGWMIAIALFCTTVFAAPAAAQVHSLTLGGGLFSPRGVDGRSGDDIIAENIVPFAFELKDFRNFQLLGEWNMTFSDRIEVSLGAGYYAKKIPSVYRDWTNLVNGREVEIEQDFRLSIVPFSAVVRFMPFGDAGRVQPYVGGGLAALRWNYTEQGQFIDFEDNNAVFTDRFAASGTAVGPMLLAGVKAPIRGDVYAWTAEMRYQFGTGDLGTNNGFPTSKVDLSGLNLTVGFVVRF